MEQRSTQVRIGADLLPAGARGLVLRSWSADDLGRAQEVIQAIGPGFLGDGLQSWEEAFVSPHDVMWTAEIDGRAVGFAGYTRMQDGLVLFHTDLVAPEAQRRGIGTALTLLRLATLDSEEVRMVVLQSTEHSLPFYQRFGFEPAPDHEWDEGAKVWLRWMGLELSEQIGEAAAAALGQGGVRSPIDSPELL